MNTGKKQTKIIITGFGGQGIILAGRILGEAAALGDKKESTLVQSYGPESRGGSCSAQVIIADKTIHYPYIKYPDILICMSQSGCDKFAANLIKDGFLISDEDLIKPPKNLRRNSFFIPATRMAEKLGQKMMANIIMTGFSTAITGMVSVNAARKTVEKSVPKGTEKKNIDAFNKGYEYGVAALKGREKKAAGKTGAFE